MSRLGRSELSPNMLATPSGEDRVLGADSRRIIELFDDVTVGPHQDGRGVPELPRDVDDRPALMQQLRGEAVAAVIRPLIGELRLRERRGPDASLEASAEPDALARVPAARGSGIALAFASIPRPLRGLDRASR